MNDEFHMFSSVHHKMSCSLVTLASPSMQLEYPYLAPAGLVSVAWHGHLDCFGPFFADTNLTDTRQQPPQITYHTGLSQTNLLRTNRNRCFLVANQNNTRLSYHSSHPWFGRAWNRVFYGLSDCRRETKHTYYVTKVTCIRIIRKGPKQFSHPDDFL